MKSWLQDNCTEIYLTQNGGKDLFEPWRIKSINIWLQDQKMCILIILDDIVSKYNYTYHKAIKMKPVDVKLSIYIDFDVENNDKCCNLKLVIM